MEEGFMEKRETLQQRLYRKAFMLSVFTFSRACCGFLSL